jgi:hypothetical protein
MGYDLIAAAAAVGSSANAEVISEQFLTRPSAATK